MRSRSYTFTKIGLTALISIVVAVLSVAVAAAATPIVDFMVGKNGVSAFKSVGMTGKTVGPMIGYAYSGVIAGASTGNYLLGIALVIGVAAAAVIAALKFTHSWIGLAISLIILLVTVVIIHAMSGMFI